MFRTAFIAIVACALASPAGAHVSFVQSTAAPGSYTGSLRVSHGCDGSATTSIRVEIPEGVTGAKPQAKQGWTIKVERVPLAQPVKGEGGKTVSDRVSAITWTGALPDDEFDDFTVLLKLPKTAGPVYFRTMQTCQAGSSAWTDIPAEGQDRHDIKHPAPVLNVGEDAGMDMTHMNHAAR